jgi:hypothetical protein
LEDRSTHVVATAWAEGDSHGLAVGPFGTRCQFWSLARSNSDPIRPSRIRGVVVADASTLRDPDCATYVGARCTKSPPAGPTDIHCATRGLSSPRAARRGTRAALRRLVATASAVRMGRV